MTTIIKIRQSEDNKKKLKKQIEMVKSNLRRIDLNYENIIRKYNDTLMAIDSAINDLNGIYE